MKMTKTSYEKILKDFDAKMESIQEYIPKLKESGNYNDFNTRLAFDCARAFLEMGWACSLYDAEGLNDTHLKTAYIKALKELELI
mgnify:FL=1